MTYTTLVTAAQVRELIAAGAPCVLLDAGFDLADTSAGERSYREGHLPGARYAHLDRDLSGAKNGRNGRHPLPAREDFAATVGAWGITPGTQVIVYDRQQAMFAARPWWMLRWLGHAAVAVLDGGAAAWQGAGGALEIAVPPASPGGRYPASAPLVPSIDADQLAARLGRVRLVDARAPERYRGEVEPLDAQAGHIPGALNRFFKDNLAGDGRFKPAAQLRAEFAPLLAGQPAEQVVHQCGSGATACHNVLAMEVAGLGTSVLYPGSWSEWSADPSRPVARG
ncbi:MAG TPA: sulfurtransferase [Albitalea sp.]|nr:sulfurtransferase [Albitalea sp.]